MTPLPIEAAALHATRLTLANRYERRIPEHIQALADEQALIAATRERVLR